MTATDLLDLVEQYGNAIRDSRTGDAGVLLAQVDAAVTGLCGDRCAGCDHLRAAHSGELAAPKPPADTSWVQMEPR